MGAVHAVAFVCLLIAWKLFQCHLMAIPHHSGVLLLTATLLWLLCLHEG